jgi:hypothetical protein
MDKSQPQSRQSVIGTTDQQLQLRHLNQAGVRYLAFGDFALNTLRKQDTSSTIQLWIDPTTDNINRVNQAFRGMYGLDTDRQLDPELADNPKTQLVLSTAQPVLAPLPGILGQRAAEPGLKLYTGIYGFNDSPAAFESAWQRRQTGTLTALTADRKLNGRVGYNQLGLADLRQNVTASGSRAKDFMLVTITDYARKNSIDLPWLPLDGHQREAPQPGVARPIVARPDTGKKQVAGQETTPSTTSQARATRDINQIRERLDIELVLQHYGYEFNTRKGRPGHKWRVYDQPDTGDRIMVVADSDTKKMFHHMETGERGGAISFIMSREQETSMGPATWKRIDAILTGEGYAERRAKLEPMDGLIYPITDARLRQIDLVDRYQVQALKNPSYLTDRAITPDVLTNGTFNGRIKTAISSGEKNGKSYAWENIAFPLCIESGQIVSLDMRNKNATGQTFKAFPKGTRGSAVWHSNPIYETKEPIIHQPDAHGRMLTEGGMNTPPGDASPGGTETAQTRHIIPEGTRGTLYQSPNQKVVVFDYQDQQGQRAQTLIYPERVNTAFKRGQADRIVVCESPVDSISFHQLNPPLPGEHRLYVATCGTPGAGQKAHINTLLRQHPASQVIIAQDGDNAGIRFAINYLALSHPAADPANTIIPHIVYQEGSRQPGNGPRQEVIEPIQIGTVIIPAGATGHIETSPSGGPVQFVFTDAQGKQLRKELSEEERKDHLREAPKGRNSLELMLRAPQTTDSVNQNPDQGHRQNERFVDELAASLRKIVRKETFSPAPDDTDYKVTVSGLSSRQESMPGQDVSVTQATLVFPNQSNLLIRALQQIEAEYQLRQRQPLLLVIRPTPIQKDFNDVLKARRGKAFTNDEPSNLKTGAVPRLTRQPLSQRQEQYQSEPPESPTQQIATYHPADKPADKVVGGTPLDGTPLGGTPLGGTPPDKPVPAPPGRGLKMS